MFAFEILSFEMFYFSELFETIANDLNVSTVMTRISIRDSEANIKEVDVGGLTTTNLLGGPDIEL